MPPVKPTPKKPTKPPVKPPGRPDGVQFIHRDSPGDEERIVRPVRPQRPNMVADHRGKIVMSPRIILDPNEIAGKTISIMGMNGSGKSGTARKMMEEHIKLGLPFAVADIENEYATLKELGEILLAGPVMDNQTIPLDIVLSQTEEFHAFGRRCFEERLSVVLLIGEMTDEDTRKQYLKAFLQGIFDAANDPTKKHYYRVFLEETQEWISQVGGDKKDPLRQMIIRFGKRGRKRMICLTLISQRPSNVDKDVLTQAHLFFWHFVSYPTDIDLYDKNFDISPETIRAMKTGDCVFMHGRNRVDDHITKPLTSSPWDENTHFDVSKFKIVSGLEALQEKVVEEGKSESGMTVILTKDLHRLRTELEIAQGMQVSVADTIISLEDEIKQLHARAPVTVTGDEDKDELLARLQAVTEERDQARRECIPLKALTSQIARKIASLHTAPKESSA